LPSLHADKCHIRAVNGLDASQATKLDATYCMHRRKARMLCMCAHLCETCVWEHANLADDVVPGARSTNLFQSWVQLFPHSDDPVCHALQLNLQHIHLLPDIVYVQLFGKSQTGALLYPWRVCIAVSMTHVHCCIHDTGALLYPWHMCIAVSMTHQHHADHLATACLQKHTFFSTSLGNLIFVWKHCGDEDGAHAETMLNPEVLTFHWLYNSGSDRIAVTIAAPCRGGLLYMGRMTCTTASSSAIC